GLADGEGSTAHRLHCAGHPGLSRRPASRPEDRLLAVGAGDLPLHHLRGGHSPPAGNLQRSDLTSPPSPDLNCSPQKPPAAHRPGVPAMAPAVDPVISDEVLPQKADVVVIGAGIIGVCASLYLAERGLRVVLCEKGKVAGEQSSRNWGWVRTTGRDSREMPLILEAQRLWDLLSEQTGVDVVLRRPVIAYLAETEKKVAGFERWLEMARDYQTGSRLVTGAELEALVPGARMPFKAALYTPNDGRAEPQRAAPAIAEAARSLGVKIFTRCAARGLE